jgi:hypothetical protein
MAALVSGRAPGALPGSLSTVLADFTSAALTKVFGLDIVAVDFVGDGVNSASSASYKRLPETISERLFEEDTGGRKGFDI